MGRSGSNGDRVGAVRRTLRHQRFTPVAHGFTYPLFMALLDVDRLPELMRLSRLTGYNRWNWASFDDRDHLGDPTRPLRDRLALDATRHGINLPDGRIFLLIHLRYLGYSFNPVSFFYGAVGLIQSPRPSSTRIGGDSRRNLTALPGGYAQLLFGCVVQPAAVNL
jgi:hypothetical protein